MSATPATQYLDDRGVEYQLHTYEVHINDNLGLTYGEAVADEIGADRNAVFKTLIATVDQTLVVAVIPVTATLNLKALARACGGKRAELSDPAAAERSTGYVIGGISPLGQRRRLRTILDETIGGVTTVYVSAGKRGLQLSIGADELIAETTGIVASIADLH